MIWKNIVLLAVPKGDPTEIRAGPQLYRIGVRRVRVPSSVESVKRSAPQRLPYVFAGAVLHDVIDALTVRREHRRIVAVANEMAVSPGCGYPVNTAFRPLAAHAHIARLDAIDDAFAICRKLRLPDHPGAGRDRLCFAPVTRGDLQGATPLILPCDEDNLLSVARIGRLEAEGCVLHKRYWNASGQRLAPQMP